MFTSVRFHQGKQLSRQDDFESLIYMLLYLMTGSLPWSSLLESELSQEEVMAGISDLKLSFSH